MAPLSSGHAWMGLMPAQNGARVKPNLIQGHAALGEQIAQVKYHRENLLVPVGALFIVGLLFQLDDPAILLEDAFGEPRDEGPEEMDQARNRRLLHHDHPEGVVDPLFLVDGNVDVP